MSRAISAISAGLVRDVHMQARGPSLEGAPGAAGMWQCGTWGATSTHEAPCCTTRSVVERAVGARYELPLTFAVQFLPSNTGSIRYDSPWYEMLPSGLGFPPQSTLAALS
jgi:hypothetical protein